MLPGILGIMAGLGGEDVTLVHTSSSASETAQYGAEDPDRWIVVLALGGNDANPYNLAATISGVSGTVIIRHSSGTGGGNATGTAIIVGQPSGTSGTVSITGISGTRRFYVLRVVGYDLSAAVFTDDSDGAGIPPWSANVPAGGLTLAICQSGPTGPATLAWTGLTERIPDAALITSHPSSAAWDLNMAADGAKSINVTSSDTDGNTSAVIATFNPS